MLTRKLFWGGGGLLPDLHSLGLTKSYTAGVTSKTFLVLVVVVPSRILLAEKSYIPSNIILSWATQYPILYLTLTPRLTQRTLYNKLMTSSTPSHLG